MIETVGIYATDEALPLLPNQLAHVRRAEWTARTKVYQPNLNGVVALAFPDSLDISALRMAIGRLIERHEALRTTFVTESAQQFVRTYDGEIPVTVVRDHPVGEEALAAAAAAERERAFDRRGDPLLRATVIERNEAACLILTVDHIVTDGWSFRVLLEELASVYEDVIHERDVQLDSRGPSYSAYVREASAWLSSSDAEHLRQYWHAVLDTLGPMPAVDFPRHRRPPGYPSFGLASKRRVLADLTVDELRTAARASRTTPFVLFSLACSIVLAAHTEDCTLGILIPVANRSGPSTRRLVAWVANTVVLRIDLDRGETIRQAVATCHAQTLKAVSAGRYPFHSLISELTPDKFGRVRSHAAAGVAFDERPSTPLTLGGMPGRSIELPDFALHGLRIAGSAQESELGVKVNYEPEWLTAADAEALINDVECALELVMSKPDISVGDAMARMSVM